MTIEKRPERAGVNVHLEPEECELFMKLASDPGTITRENETSLALSLTLGRKINALLSDDSDRFGGLAARPLARSMIDLILADDI